MSIIHLTDKNFDSEMKDHDEPMVIDFWAPWCGPCRMMGPVFEELSSEYKGKLRFAKLNTEEHPQIAQQFEIRGIPSLVFIRKGEEIDRLVGFKQKEELKDELDSLLSA